jgi:hypothetical protein
MSEVPETEISELTIAELPEPLPPPEEERAKIDRELAAYRRNPGGVSPWPDIKERILGRA